MLTTYWSYGRISRYTIPPNAPVGPVWPICPVGPVGPVTPIIPVEPVAPEEPVPPVMPIRPVGPVRPVGPHLYLRFSCLSQGFFFESSHPPTRFTETSLQLPSYIIDIRC